MQGVPHPESTGADASGGPGIATSPAASDGFGCASLAASRCVATSLEASFVRPASTAASCPPDDPAPPPPELFAPPELEPLAPPELEPVAPPAPAASLPPGPVVVLESDPAPAGPAPPPPTAVAPPPAMVPDGLSVAGPAN